MCIDPEDIDRFMRALEAVEVQLRRQADATEALVKAVNEFPATER